MYNKNNHQQTIVSPGKNPSTKHGTTVLIIMALIGLAVIALILLFSAADNHQSDESVDVSVNHPTSQAINLSTTSTQQQANKARPRIVYRLYDDPINNQIYLFKMTFLTKNQLPDTLAVRIEQHDSKFFAYDSLTKKSIVNITNITNHPLVGDVAIVYSDDNYLLLKNKNEMGYQLEMIDPFSGEVKWTISELELVGLNKLTGIYSEQNKMGIKLIEDEFNLMLPPNHFVINKQGELIDFNPIVQ